ncbi:hypothetical protein VPH35_132908 [Triticum aestivum]
MGSSSSTCKRHPAHPEHKLTLETPERRKFTCDGCHKKGGGERYRCQSCNFNLHKQCALREGTKIVHPSLKNITIKLRFQVPRSEGARLVCDACRGTVRGFHYHSSKLCLHPCCVYPPEENDGGAEGQLRQICQTIAPAVLSLILTAATGDPSPIIGLFPCFGGSG